MFKYIFKFQAVTIICQILSFLSSWQIAHFLDVTQRGLLGKYVLYTSMIFSISSAGFTEYITMAMKDNNNVNVKRLILFASFSSISLLMLLKINNILSISFLNFIYISIVSFFYFYSTFSLTFIWNLGYFRMMNILRVLHSLIPPVILYLLSIFDLNNESNFFISIFGVYFITSLIHLIWQQSIKVSIFNFKSNINLRLLLNNSTSSFFLIILFNVDKILISNSVSVELFARYLIAISIFSPFTELLASVSSVILLKVKSSFNIYNGILFLLVVYLIAFLLVSNLFVNLIPIVFGEKYRESVTFSRYFPVMFYFIVCFRLFDSLLRVYNLKFSVYINIIGLILFISIFFIFKEIHFQYSMARLSYILTCFFGFLALIQFIVYYNYGKPRAH